MPSQHWTARIAWIVILLITLLRAVTDWASKQPAQHIELGVMLVALGIVLWDWWLQRTGKRRRQNGW